jgi:hypothetical protein
MNRGGKLCAEGSSVNWIAKLNVWRPAYNLKPQTCFIFLAFFYEAYYDYFSLGVIMPLDPGGFTIHDSPGKDFCFFFLFSFERPVNFAVNNKEKSNNMSDPPVLK